MTMQKSNAEILNHFYSLLLEMNFHQADDEILSEKVSLDDPLIQKHLQKIKLLSAKYKAIRTKNRYAAIVAEIKRLKDLGIEEIQKLLNPQEEVRLMPLFRRFEELSEKDEASIVEDQEMLQLIDALKEKLDNPESDE